MIFGGAGDRCGECHTHTEEARRWNGCSRDAGRVVASIKPCPWCRGVKGAECDRCVDGEWHSQRCPGAVVDVDAVEFVGLAAYAAEGSFPVAGGTTDQTGPFLDGLAIVNTERNRYRKAQRGNHPGASTA